MVTLAGHSANAWFIVHQLVFSFRLRTCGEARIQLFEDPFDWSQYSREIVIGGFNNTKSIIYGTGNVTLAERDTVGIVQCEDSQQFWISWQGKLAVGKGMINSEEFLSYADVFMRPIHGVSVLSGESYAGEWQFTRDAGEFFCCNLNT